MPGATGRNGTPSAVTAKRKADAVALALSGMSYGQIAERVGYADRGAAWRAVMSVLRENVPANVDELRAVEGARLDALLTAYFARAMRGDLRAAEFVLRVIDKRNRLFGLDAPVRVDVRTTDLDAQIEGLLSELAALPPVVDSTVVEEP